MTTTQPTQLESDSTIINALRKRGYRATSQRIAICRVAMSNHEHPSARNIHRDVRKLHPTVSLATVYKTLQVLRDNHLVQELAFAQTETRFDANVRPHVNVLCLQCGRISDVDDQSVTNLVSTVASRSKFTVTGQRFDIYGICEKCAKKRTITL
jgi:Fur family peroxide stress response transcriptional regulator